MHLIQLHEIHVIKCMKQENEILKKRKGIHKSI